MAPVPMGQNLEEHEHRKEQLPTGHESLTKDVTARSGQKGHGGTFR